jgi:hypothetical protein
MLRTAVLLVASASMVWSQATPGSITGIVTDKTGAVVVGATVTLTNSDTGVSLRTTTNEAGVYAAPSLIAGPYTVEIDFSGFKKHQVRGVVVETGQKLRLDAQLDIGDMAERVEVQAAITPLQQETAEVSKTITSSEMRNIPLSYRTAYGLMTLSAGISSTGNDPSLIGPDDVVSINGSRKGANAFMIDGAATTHIGGIPERLGSIEAIQEAKILASTYSAEYGRTSGGVVMFQVKSGTQQYHGSLYEFHRNSALNATQWENNARGTKQNALIRNEFGVTLGGPVPKMGNKLFFFGSYEGLRDRIPGSKTRTIPEPALRGGNFSSVPVVVNDPLTGAAFPGNIIPQSRLDPAAVKFLALFPEPNVAGVFNSRYGIRSSNWALPLPTSDYKNFGVGRLDYNPSDRQKFFFTYSHINEGPRDNGRDFLNVLNTTVGPRMRDIRRATLGYTRFIRPNLTSEFIASAQRDPRSIDPWYSEFDVTKELGIARKTGNTLPLISIAGGYGSFGNSAVQRWIHQPASMQNIVTWTRGAHNIRTGGQLYQNQFWYISANDTTGSYSFNGEITGLGTSGRDNPVNALADLLLGAVKTSAIPVPQIPVNRMNYNLALFVNDDWKLTRKLTLNLGLRYEFETRQIVKNDVYSRVDLATGNLLVADQNASRNLNLNNKYFNLSPRIGFAYSLDAKTVVRSGFGVFRSNLWVDNGEMVTYPGWTGSQVQVDQGVGRAQPFRFSDGFPVEQAPAVTDPLQLAASATVTNPLSVGAVTYSPDDKLPTNYQWNIGIQREAGFHTVFDVSYVASRSLYLARTIPANNPTLDRAADVVIRRVPIQQVRPYPRYSGFNAVFYDARASYHSLQFRAQRRFAEGLTLDGSYTFSKNIDTASGVNDSFQIPWQFANLEKALSSLDRPHIFNFGWVYELPMGKGKPLFADNRVLSALLGGFQVNGVLNMSSGLPLTIRQANTNLILAAQRPDVVDPSRLDGKIGTPFFSGATRRWFIAPDSAEFPFVQSSNTGFGNLGRNTSREPGFWNVNASIFRRLKLTERANLELRFEAFNALNHVNYLEPASTDITNVNYGLITGTAPARQVQIGARISF